MYKRSGWGMLRLGKYMIVIEWDAVFVENQAHLIT